MAEALFRLRRQSAKNLMPLSTTSRFSRSIVSPIGYALLARTTPSLSARVTAGENMVSVKASRIAQQTWIMRAIMACSFRG
jgi:hypothetical protein